MKKFRLSLNGTVLSEMLYLLKIDFISPSTIFPLISDIDECESGPCQNNGTCTDGTNLFSCQCMPGWNGTKCETSKHI